MDSFAAHIVAMPYPGRGHINPMLNFCRLLSSRLSLLITFVVTEEWLDLLLPSISPLLPPSLCLRSVPNVIPSELTRGSDYSAFVEAVLADMELPFDLLLDGLADRPPAGILADSYLPWAVAVGNRRNIPVYSLCTQAASVFAVFYHLNLLVSDHQLPAAELSSEMVEKCVNNISGISLTRITDLHSILCDKKLRPKILDVFSWITKTQCLLFTSFYELEPAMIDTLRTILPIPVYLIGPSIPFTAIQDTLPKSKPINSNMDYITWLDSQPEGSVLYVSLGSFLPFSGPQMEEIAMGLQASGIRYLRVVRSSLSQARVGDTGFLVPWWVQLEVLCHSSVGGFLTHCGWNSTLEGLYAGLPLLAYPLSLDQFSNCKMIVDDWKVGVRMEGGQEDHHIVIRRAEIEKLVRMVMDLDGEESKALRGRAKALQEKCHGALEEGGSLLTDLNAFIKNIKSRGV